MHQPALTKKIKKPPLANAQATFSHYRKKISQLQQQLENVNKAYEQALKAYHHELKPHQKKTGDLVAQFILKVMALTQNAKVLSEKEQLLLQKLFKNSLNLLFDLLPYGEIDDKLQKLYEKVYGRSRSEEFYQEVSEIKEMLKEQTGISDLEFPEINPDDDPDDIIRKIFTSFEPFDKENKELPPKEKSAKEFLREQRAQELEALQNKNLSSIYKRLVKALHPDLEQDVHKKAEKEELMKELTVAYEKHNLISLLALEAEWLDKENAATASLDLETIKTYNSLLKDQIEELKQALLMRAFDPRYAQIEPYVRDFQLNPMAGIKRAIKDCLKLTDEYTHRLNDLSGKNPLAALKKGLAAFNEEASFAAFMDNFLDALFEDEEFKTQKPPKKTPASNKKILKKKTL